MFLIATIDMFTEQTNIKIGTAIRKEIERFSKTSSSAGNGGLITGILPDIPVIGMEKPTMNVFAVCRYKIVNGEIKADSSNLYVFVFDEMPDEILDIHLAIKKAKTHE